MTDTPQRPVLGRPPVDGSEEELDRWVEGLLDALLGPEESGAEVRPSRK